MTSTYSLPATLRVVLTPVAACIALYGASANAVASMVETEVPGLYRTMIGDFEVTALSDGTVVLPVDKLLTNTTPGKVDAALGKSFLQASVETSVNRYLINTGDKLVLVDTGGAGLFGPTRGSLVADVKAAGYQPKLVDAVVITPMHLDHFSGLMAGDRLAFPNVTVHADRRLSDHWLATQLGWPSRMQWLL